MSQSEWSKTEIIVFGAFYVVVGIAGLTMAIAQLIEACQTRPKVQMMVLSLKGVKEPAKSGPDESPSAAE